MNSKGGAGSEVRAVRRVASGILAALFAIFLATFLTKEPPLWLLLLRAMAEAGMVGGLADWFAVEALFRRPLGLPIPHTALLPANQQRAARNIARFIDEHFLVPAELARQIAKFDPVGQGARWLQEPENARSIGRELSWALRLLYRSELAGGVTDRIRQSVMTALQEAAASGRLSDQAVAIIREAIGGEVLDSILRRIRNKVQDRRAKITDLVQERSRWWIAKGIDRRVSDTLVDGIISVIDELGEPDSALRQDFEAAIGDIAEGFRGDGLIDQFLGQSLEDYEGTAAFSGIVDRLLDAMQSQIETRLAEDPEAVAQGFGQVIADIAAHILRDDTLRQSLSQRFEAALEQFVQAMREPVRGYVDQTISGWDSDALVARIEGEVGRDLQFIRINGAVLGAALGGVIFVFSHILLV